MFSLVTVKDATDYLIVNGRKEYGHRIIWFGRQILDGKHREIVCFIDWRHGLEDLVESMARASFLVGRRWEVVGTTDLFNLEGTTLLNALTWSLARAPQDLNQ
jgi:hypothetical protein